MLREFCQNCFPHDVVLDAFPIWPKRTRTASPHPCRNHWRFGQSNGFFMFGPGKFLRLEIMLRSGPDTAFQRERMRGEVGKFPVCLVQAVEKDLLHIVCSFVYSAITSI